MARTGWSSPLAAAIGAATLLAVGSVAAQQTPAPAGQAPGGGGRGPGGGRGGGMAGPLFTAADTDKDGSVTRQEFTGTFDKWFSEWSGGWARSSGAPLPPSPAAGL